MAKLKGVFAAISLVALTAGVARVGAQSAVSTADHPIVGSWFGKAMQVCPQGVAPSACANALPAATLFMTPTLAADGTFLGNDDFAILDPPYGPHTTAHGQWYATSATEFTAEYVFMSNTYPPKSNTVSAVRFRWQGRVTDADTAVGYVNLYSFDPIPIAWNALGPNEFPAFPKEALPLVTSPSGFVTDPTLCRPEISGCPQVFKFTIKRIRR